MQINSNFKEIYLIGDTLSDGIAANKLNIKFVKALYGYGKDENWSEIDVFNEIGSLREVLII